jgi:hypothetical protein
MDADQRANEAAMRITFESIKASAAAHFKCTECGKRRKRATTIEHTVSPFNKNANGVPKSREQVQLDVQREARAWTVNTKTCAACEREEADKKWREEMGT